MSAEKESIVSSTPPMEVAGSLSSRSAKEEVAAWAQYVPGPNHTYRFDKLSPSVTRLGVLLCGCSALMFSGYSK